MGVYEVTIPGWHPAAANELSASVRQRMRLKKRDRNVVAAYVRVRARVPLATGKRRVGLTLSYEPGARRHDVDAFWKSALDALKQNGLIVDDGPLYCELAPVRYDTERRPGGTATTITLEDLGPEGPGREESGGSTER